jgi:hypothetical protein
MVGQLVFAAAAAAGADDAFSRHLHGALKAEVQVSRLRLDGSKPQLRVFMCVRE